MFGSPGAMRAPFVVTALILNLVTPWVAARAAKLTVVYAFQGGSDGAYPNGALVDVGGTLYGTTGGGGASGAGTVYAIAPDGTETVLYSFKTTGGDAEGPSAALTPMGGLLYGTATSGGAHGKGAIFSVSTAGAESVVFSFADGRDGTIPEDGLIAIGNKLYGTAAYGGGSAGGSNCRGMGCGTVFSLRPGHHLKTLHVFTDDPDGAFPEGIGAGLLNVGGTLYGTTRGGGVNGGIVYSITRTGSETVLHEFTAGSDGWAATPSLIEYGGSLYGTTQQGGNCCGIVFAVTPLGAETIVHEFNGTDGSGPLTGLTKVNATLYGTTAEGGKFGLGTIFAIDPATNSETVLHSFAGGADGISPEGDLIDVNGVLWGTTVVGGGTGCGSGCGTVFKLTR